jgi:hypothetical protein
MEEERQTSERRRRGGTIFLVAVAVVLCALVVLGGIAWAAALVITDLSGTSRSYGQKASEEASARRGQAPAFEVEKLDAELGGQKPVPGVSLEGTEGDDTTQGTDERDALGGLSGDDELSGYGGDDRIGGDFGNDTLYGGAGSDVLLGGDNDDVLDDGDDGERDTVRCGHGYDKATVGPEDDVYQCEEVAVR